MAVEFRCEKCGKLLNAEADADGLVRCPNCRRRVAVPAGLAALPSPRLPAAPRPPRAAKPPGPPPPPAEAEPDPAAVGALAGAMPWVLSVFLHVGLFLVMLFLVMVSTRPTPEAMAVEIFQSEPFQGTFGGMVDPKTKEFNDAKDDRRTIVRRTKDTQKVQRTSPDDTKVDLIAPGSEGRLDSARGELGLVFQDIRGGPRLYDEIGPRGVRNIVYVVDRSGSMASEFDEVRKELIDSIAHLRPVHSFHVILFGDGRAIEGPLRRLVPADQKHKDAAGRFLGDKAASGQTTALVALQRAFAVLKQAEDRHAGSLIFLLSDGDFAGITGGSSYRTADGRLLNGNEAVLQWLRDHNAEKGVLINTLLLHRKDPTAVAVLERIARENGGRFKYISPDE